MYINITEKYYTVLNFRMSTVRETKFEFMSKEFFGNLIYENFLFDIPRLMDISALYGSQYNIKLVRRIVRAVFESQPSYVDDLQQAAKTVVEVSFGKYTSFDMG